MDSTTLGSTILTLIQQTLDSTILNSIIRVFYDLEFNGPWIPQTLDSTILNSPILGFNNTEFNDPLVQGY